MWHDHPFSQRNRTLERPLGVGVGGDRVAVYRGEGWKKLEKKEGEASLCQLCKKTLKIYHPAVIKLTPHSWLSSKNFQSLPLQSFLKNLTPLF